jgi:hypothetical protein
MSDLLANANKSILLRTIGRVACLLLGSGLVAGCGTITTKWTDLTGAGRGANQRAMDAGACEMMLQQSSLGQPPEAGSNTGNTMLIASAWMTQQQNFRESCMLSRGWQEIVVNTRNP